MALKCSVTGFLISDICGIDEAGRGPLAGPVHAACVIIPEAVHPLPFVAALNDSKKLTEARRDALFTEITQHCPYGIGTASVEEIDRLNILQATFLAMQRAFGLMTAAFDVSPAQAFVDGNQKIGLPCHCTPVVGGDGLMAQIAAASILAKVSRDRLMRDIHHDYPLYGWNSNMGYGTPSHLESLRLYGPTPHHRQSFAPVREAGERVA